jgi:phenylpyruvate tautomerase PptA (4-oxalocrotonate tautomerase family)
MPIYQCYVPAGSLDADTRAELAEAITDIHCTVTVAPRGFAHVVFIEYGETSFFTAGKPNNLDCAPQEPQNGPVAVSPLPPFPLGSTSVSFHCWSTVSLISLCISDTEF